MEGQGDPALISVRLTKLHLPNGASVDLETNSITRLAKPISQKNTVGMATGFDETIAELTGKPAEQTSRESRFSGSDMNILLNNHAVFPENSSLVFTLDSDLIVTAPQ